MPNVEIPAANAAFSADGDAQGYITVASNAAFYPGAKVWLIKPLGGAPFFLPLLQQAGIITDLNGATKIGVRFDNPIGTGPSYGRNDCSAFTLADGSYIMQERQLVRVEQPIPEKRLVV